MAIKDLPKYVDIRGSIRRKGRYPLVGTAVKDTHVIHHSLTKTGSPEAFANYHIDNNGWFGIAYHFVIQLDGTIYHCDDLDRRTYHAGNTNTRAIGTCLVGDFRKGTGQLPTQAQLESLYLLNKELYNELPNMKITKGHQECDGYSWKNCPGDGWNYRRVLNGELVLADDIAIASAAKPSLVSPKVYGSTGKKVHLPADATSWRIYPLHKSPVKANAIATIKPAKFGGLTYDILYDRGEIGEHWVFEIGTRDYGRVKIYAHPNTGATVI